MKLFSHYLQSNTKSDSQIINWHENQINDLMLYSYRDTEYNCKTYPSNMHYHDYYELVILEAGDISYVCESSVYRPKSADVILIPPRALHMSKINSEHTRYIRHVFYFYPETFERMGHGCLSSFLGNSDNSVLLNFISDNTKELLLNTLNELKATCKKDITPYDKALCFSYILQLFCLLNTKDFTPQKSAPELPQSIMNIKQYIDNNFSEVSSVGEIAAHFFYSREYISRAFKKHFGTTVVDYIHQRRISESQSLLAAGATVTESCYKVGFGSLPTFIRVFTAITGMKPSEYRTSI